jgi:hypothetical protein
MFLTTLQITAYLVLGLLTVIAIAYLSLIFHDVVASAREYVKRKLAARRGRLDWR